MKAHKWLAGKLDSTKCAVCKRGMLDHTAAAVCESCTKRDDCEIIDGILMCKACQADNAKTQLEKLDETNSDAKHQPALPDHMIAPSVSDEIADMSRGFADDLPANGTEFYNKKVEAIVELRKKVFADPNIPAANKNYHFAKLLTARRLTLYTHLIQAKEIIVEIEAENSAIHRAINLEAAELKAEEREKLNIKYAEYQQKTAPVKIRTPRKSAEDNVIESIAKTIFAPKKDGIIQWEALEQHERLSLITKAKDYYNNMFKKKESTTSKGATK
jgi:hypothetical protein